MVKQIDIPYITSINHKQDPPYRILLYKFFLQEIFLTERSISLGFKYFINYRISNGKGRRRNL